MATLPAEDARERFCIIGAGPSGLAMAAAFRKRGVQYDHFERHSSVGGIWDLNNPGTPMYSSAHLISSKTLSGFLDQPMPDEFPDYPRREQVLRYLVEYAATNGLTESIRFGSTVTRVEPRPTSALVQLGSKTIEYRGVVCASGINWDPIVPTYPGEFSGVIRHASSYVDPKEFEGQRVLIVGLGNSGADIACDAVRSASRTFVSVRRGYHFIPKHIFGKPADVFAHEGPQLPLWLETWVFGWLLRLLVGDTTQLGMPKPDHRLLQSHPLMNDQLLHHLRHGDVEIRRDVSHFDGNRVHFVDQTSVEVDQVLFATGYQRRIAYLDTAVIDGSWAASHWLTAFSPAWQSLFTLGFAELNGGLFPHLSRLAALIAHVAEAQLQTPDEAQAFFDWASKQRWQLDGGRKLVASARHAHYCDDVALAAATRRAFKHMGWPCP